MSEIVVTAIITPKAGQPADQIEKSLTDHAAWVQQNEPGTLRYALHKSIGDGPTVFTMIEAYKDKAALDAHSKSPRFKELAPQLLAIADMQLFVSQPVGGFQARTSESSKI
ncbi:Antibiotic biosynthesis monooxygenase [Lasiodiplodia theobromae]|uniref:ABM domain-containing protein n=1 Tax=Lasiodiplodia theobromae TaxID=45133 RepID=A0A5N5DJ77_9PEZI|nr:Antibiotic biosynthesis monooxygenase [Lasiodiplodia theobromae]KAB2577610.1 hypothetical protein DBV05_g3718 [Lasiodiplodia theobromae]KAF4535623.1 Antibiotic biosynthesis monooxygenase [Lasiodiplodia theobromae]KAF9638908.1 Antibiotic biosynthesis monooxygenase [Lasiodiplodia theobromae]